ncbi:MAG: hypothetical protein KF893_06585 [Caldilineaceae bacterium]|nr:hypothetical protein [Caldilineaceae bacterium]
MTTEGSGFNRAIGLWMVLLLTIFAWAPATYPGYWQSSEGFAPIFNARFAAPIAEIATIPDLWRGSGSATFILTYPLIQLGISATVAVRVIFILAVILGSLGIYLWLAPRFGDRSAGLAGLSYGLMPPLLTTLYLRGNLSDALILGLLPSVLAGLTLYRLSRSPATMGLSVIALLWIWRTQAGLAVPITLLLVFYILFVERDQLAALAVSIAGIAGLLSLIPVWGIRGQQPVMFEHHFLDLYQLLVGDDPSTLFVVGFVPIGFSLIATWLLWMRRREYDRRLSPLILEQDRLLIFGLTAGGIAILLSLGISAPLWSVSGAARLFTYPGQILLPVLPFLAATAGSLPLLSPALGERSYWATLLAVVILASFPYLLPTFTRYQPPTLPVAVYGERADLVLLEATIAERSSPTGDGNAELSVVWQLQRPLPFAYNLFFQALRGDATGEGYEVIAQLDQQPLADRPATDWQPGEIFTATYGLDLPVDPNAANLRYYFGYYDWRDGVRLPLMDGDDKVILYGE